MSNQASIKYGVPHGWVLEPFLFLKYINDPSQAMRVCIVHYFTDDTNLLPFNKSLNMLNKYVNLDMKNLTVWLNTNKILPTVTEAEPVIFKH